MGNAEGNDLLPKPGRRVEEIDRQLRELLASETGLENGDVARYFIWVHQIERVLGALFVDVPADLLHTERFWQLSRHNPPPVQWMEMVGLERDRLRTWLQELLDRVLERRQHFDGSAAVAVPDTNALIHHLPPSEIDWSTLLGAPAQLAIPLRVVQELDDKKAANSKPLRVRASKRLRQLASYARGDEPHEVRPGVGIEIVRSLDLDPAVARRPRVPADVEILDFCEALATYTNPRPVYLVTGDLSMQVQTDARNVPVRLMPSDSELPLDASEAE